MVALPESPPGLAGRLISALLRGGCAVALVMFAAWTELAILFHSPLPAPQKLAVAGAVALVLLAGAMSILMRVWRRLILPVVIVALIAIVSWWSSIRPSDNRNWMPDVARKSLVTIKGDDVEIRNVRNFVWKTEDTAEQEVWQDRIYSLSDLKGLDLFVSTWGDPRIAHIITSFSFNAGPPVAFSIEIRKEKGEEYSSISGFFKQYELALVAADESDIIKVRTNRRRETVQRYRIDVKPENAAKLLRKYAELSQELQAAPRWYHTIFTNCTTTVFSLLRTISPADFPFDRRVLISGYLPDYLYDIGFLDRTQPLAEIRRRADITQAARLSEGDPNFSGAIRR